MRTFLITITVAVLATACSGVQSINRTNGAATPSLNGPGEQRPERLQPPQDEKGRDAGELSDEELELLLKEPKENGNPQYAMSPAALEDSEPTPDIGSPEYAAEYRWLAESVDNYKEVPGC